MGVVLIVQGREAIPVRSVLGITHGYVTPQDLAAELSRPYKDRDLTAYRYFDGKVDQVGHEGWGMLSDVINDIVRGFKRDEHEHDQHRQEAWRKSIETLPSGVFVWLDEFQKWYVEHVFAPNTTWAQQHLVIGKDDDPEPLFIPTRVADLDLNPIAMSDMLPVIQEGFEVELAAPVRAVGSVKTSNQSRETRHANKSPETLQFERSVMAEMTIVWNQWKKNQASDSTLAEPSKGDMHGPVLNVLSARGIKSKNKKATLQMVCDAAKPWKKPAQKPIPVSPSVAPVKRHPFKGEK